jgi:hypothetical protein
VDKNEEKAYEDAFVAGMQHDAESRVSKFIEASMRKWVGLTDEDMKDTRTHNFNFIDGARWAEAKLRSRNGG